MNHSLPSLKVATDKSDESRGRYSSYLEKRDLDSDERFLERPQAPLKKVPGIFYHRTSRSSLYNANISSPLLLDPEMTDFLQLFQND